LQQVEAEHEGIQFCIRIQRQRRAVRRGHYLDHAGMRLGRRHIEQGHAAAGDTADRESSVQHARWVVVCRIAGLAGDLQRAVTAGQGLTDVGAVPALRSDSRL
jgi:hypothetical protein